MAHAVRYFLEAREREVQLARLSEQLAGARFSALQAQLNPHFLFNTLNTIAVRARDGDGVGTARMVEQLSDVLRRTLSRHRANEVALQDELDLVEQYLAIEQARFSDRLRPSFDVDPAARAAAVPSFALQHLVENAIRHGIARRAGAGLLRVSARRAGDSLEIAVEDDGAGFDSDATARPGHGIENTRERLRALYGSRRVAHVRQTPPAAARSPRCACRGARWRWRPTLPTAEWTVLIADDEPAARRGVRQLLAPFPDFTVAAECRDGAEVLAALDTLNPHVVFLDIQMPGVDGFEVIRRRTPDRMPIVVFLTAYDQFAIRAFDAQALDYLLKPVTEARFAATMKRLVRQLKTASPRRTRAGARRHDRARRDGRARARHRLDRIGGQLRAHLDRRPQLPPARAAPGARGARRARAASSARIGAR